MTDEITALKAELAELNTKCLLARDNEIRFALQRSRLEAERASLLAKMVEAIGEPARAPATPAATPYRVTMQPAPHKPEGLPGAANNTAPKPAASLDRRKLKPDGTPPIKAMITAALKDVGRASRPTEVVNYVRSKWWPDLRATSITSVMWRMAQDGALTHAEGRYGLNGVGH